MGSSEPILRANSVSKNAQNVFNYVYTNAQNGTANAVKALPGTAGAAGTASSFLTQFGNFIGGTIGDFFMVVPVGPFLENIEEQDPPNPQT